MQMQFEIWSRKVKTKNKLKVMPIWYHFKALKLHLMLLKLLLADWFSHLASQKKS